MAINFNALLDEFKKTNWQDPGTWHWAPKILVLLAVLIGIPVAGFFADTQGQIDQLEAGRADEVKLKQDYLGKKRQAVNLDLHRQQLREIDTQFGALLRQLPNKSEMDALLVDINQAGLGRGLQFELFKPAPQETMREFYAELPIQVKVLGNYHDMGAFASDVGQLSRIVTLNDVKIDAGKDGNLAMEGVARTFRYLDDQEEAPPRTRRHLGEKEPHIGRGARARRLRRRRAQRPQAGAQPAHQGLPRPRRPAAAGEALRARALHRGGPGRPVPPAAHRRRAAQAQPERDQRARREGARPAQGAARGLPARVDPDDGHHHAGPGDLRPRQGRTEPLPGTQGQLHGPELRRRHRDRRGPDRPQGADPGRWRRMGGA